jgi:hypothetical protein
LAPKLLLTEPEIKIETSRNIKTSFTAHTDQLSTAVTLSACIPEMKIAG